MKNDESHYLYKIIERSLEDLEERGDIVITSNTSSAPSKFLYDRVCALLPSEIISTSELIGIRTLIFQAIADKNFFDWEMPTLTGFDAQAFSDIAKKLPKG